MPQVHNRTFPQEGTGVRFLASISLSESGMKAVRMKNHVERNLQKINSRRIETLASKSDRMEHKQRLKLRQSLRRMVAYRQVIENRTVARKHDYHKSLNWNYSEEGMRDDINQVLYDTDPATIQRRKERITVENNRQKYREILKQSKDNLSQIFLVKREFQKCKEGEYSETSVMDYFPDKNPGQNRVSRIDEFGGFTLAPFGEKGTPRNGDIGNLKHGSSSPKPFLFDGDEDRHEGLPPSVLTNLWKLRQITLPPIGVKFAKKDSPIIQDQQSRTSDTESVWKLKTKTRFKENAGQQEYPSKLQKEHKERGMAKFHLPPVQITKALLI